MISLMKGAGRLPASFVALGLGVWAFTSPATKAGEDEPAVAGQVRKVVKRGPAAHGSRAKSCGTLGYGPPGLHPGFQGFGLGYHPGYGYGGDALGVGAEGGYPYYGGPGYPHPWPTLRRIGGINPFPYFGGPGQPSPDHPNYFGGVGPLVADDPVITVGTDGDTPGYVGDYGPFHGTLPYPESTFAPFSSAAAVEGSSGGAATTSNTDADAAPAPGVRPAAAPTPLGPGKVADLSTPSRSLGIDAEPVVDADGVRGIKVSRLYPGSAAEKAGLRSGDVIHSINGHLTIGSGNLEWIIANATTNNRLKMSVNTASDGKMHTIIAQLP